MGARAFFCCLSTLEAPQAARCRRRGTSTLSPHVPRKSASGHFNVRSFTVACRKRVSFQLRGARRGHRVGPVQRTLQSTGRHFLLLPAGGGLQGGRRGSRTPGPRLRDLLLSRQFRTPSAGAFREADSTGVEPVGRVATPCCFQGSSPRRLGVLSMADTVGFEPTHGLCRVRISNPLHYRSATYPRGGVRICPTPLVPPTPPLGVSGPRAGRDSRPLNPSCAGRAGMPLLTASGQTAIFPHHHPGLSGRDGMASRAERTPRERTL